MRDVDALVAELRAGLEGVTPGPWIARMHEKDGELRDCFVQAPDVNGFAYKAEILGDDEYREESGGIQRKAADARHIARCSPENIAALLDHIEALTLERDNYKTIADSKIVAFKSDALESERSRVDRLEKALEEAEETLRLAEHPAFPDPAHHDEVKRLGRRIGFGALMSTASAGWREVLQERGDPAGGEFVAGPCHSTVVYALRVIRAALAKEDGR